MRSFSHTGNQTPIAAQTQHGCKYGVFDRRNDDCIFPIANDLRDTSGTAGQNGKTVIHGFEYSQTKCFMPRQTDKDIGRIIPFRHHFAETMISDIAVIEFRKP